MKGGNGTYRVVKVQIDWKTVRILISPSAVLAIIAVIILFVIPAYANFSYFLFGIAFNIVITVFVIDMLIRYRQEQRWAKVRNLTLTAISTLLCDVASSIWEYGDVAWDLIDGIGDGRNELNPNTPRAFERLADALAERARRDDFKDDSEIVTASDIVVKYYKKYLWELNQIQLVLTPFVVTSSSDQKLIDALFEFDTVHREFCIGIRAAGMVGEAWDRMVDLVRSSGKLYEAILGSMKE